MCHIYGYNILYVYYTWYHIIYQTIILYTTTFNPFDIILFTVYIIFYRYDGIVDLSSAECYDPNCNKWSAVTSLGTKRSCLGISANHGLLYVCGGFDGASCLSSVERYDPLTGVWSSCPSMTTRRRYCRVSVVGKTNKLNFNLRVFRVYTINIMYLINKIW